VGAEGSGVGAEGSGVGAEGSGVGAEGSGVSARSTDVLPDVLEPGLRVVFCGTAVRARSAQVGAYYAGPGNQFWSVLHRVGLTPRALLPTEFRELPKHGVGLTDLAKKMAGGDVDVSASAFDVDATRGKNESFAPRVLAFNGKASAKAFLRRPVEYGRQRESLGETAIFVLPSTSGAARGCWDESHWKALAEFVSSDARASPNRA
jgi:TDG/mug DNA glycosylase family protein